MLLFISGCSVENFFDISDTIEAPISSYEQESILKCAEDCIGSDMKLKYPLYKRKYRSCIVTDFENTDLQGENFALLFCEKGLDSGETHILFLKKSQNKWEVFKDIKRVAATLEKVYIQDVDNDGNNEFAFVFKNSDKKHGNVYTYRYEKGDIAKVNLPNKFFNNFKDDD